MTALYQRLRGMRPADFLRSAPGKAFITMGDQGVVSAASFAVQIILGRACSKEEFGLYALGFTIVLCATNFQNALVNSPYMVFSPRLKGAERAQYTGSNLLHQVSFAFLVILILGGAAATLSFGIGPPGLDRVLWTLVVVIGFILLKEYARQISFARLQVRTALMLDTGVSVLQIAGLVALAFLGPLSARRAYWVIGLGAGLAALLWLGAMRKAFAPRLTPAWRDFRSDWRYSRWLVAQTLAYMGSNQLYPWLLASFHGTEANGVYGACYSIVMLSNPFLLGMGNFLGPKTVHAFAEEGVPGMQRVVNKALLFFAAIMALFCAAVMLGGNWALVILYKEKYAGYGDIVTLLALGQFVWALIIPTNYGLNAMERPDVAFKSLLLALLITLTFGIWLVKDFGPAGVAAGLLLGNIVSLLFTRIVFERQIRLLEAELPA